MAVRRDGEARAVSVCSRVGGGGSDCYTDVLLCGVTLHAFMQFHAFLLPAKNASKNMTRASFMFFTEWLVYSYNRGKMEAFKKQRAENERQAGIRASETAGGVGHL